MSFAQNARMFKFPGWVEEVKKVNEVKLGTKLLGNYRVTKMAEVLTDVYDILFPSPPPLKEIAAISIAFGLWRQEINSHRIKNILNQLNLEQDILSSDSLPRTPATIISFIKIYIRKVGLSIKQWLDSHGESKRKIFGREILNDFIDFVEDFDGSIHYVKTARRLVLCDRIDKILRFKIACWYCFEDDISQIWPSVSNDVNLTKVSSSPIPLPHYWICKLKDKLYRLPRSNRAIQLEEEIFRNNFHVRSSMEYFWNHLDVASRMRIAKAPPVNFVKIFSRYLLPKFNELELDEFAKEQGYRFIATLLSCKSTSNDFFQSRALYFRAMWVLVRNRMNGERIFRLIRRIARMQCDLIIPIDTSVYCELWNTIPDNVKPEVIQAISKGDSLFRSGYYFEYTDVVHIIHNSGLLDFLFTMLSDASIDEKNQFWNNNWRKMMNVMDSTQLNKLLGLCFDNDENKIAEFKTTTLSAWENIRGRCSKLLNYQRFEELNDFLSYCYPDDQARKTVAVNLLVEDFKLTYDSFKKISPLLIDFINDAYDDVNLATDFRTQFLFSPSSVETFRAFTHSYSLENFHHIMLVIDILAPSEQIARDFKKLHIFPMFEPKLRAGSLVVSAEGEFLNFLRKCLGSDEEIARFKQTLCMDEIIQRMIQTAMVSQGGPKFNPFLEQLLDWYFDTPQALEEFKSRYADDDEFVMLTTRK
ncbi:uncharacterized protein LOC135840817 [Planococcus citri]|uniref:uncharacterized protein LOC135840817 n=1 Tax=Planococcus citri TaxID=170843 RepID=UPI0031FA432D